MLTVLFAFTLAIGGRGDRPAIDGEAAVSVARRFVESISHYRKVELEILSPMKDRGQNYGQPPAWQVGFSSGEFFATVILSKDGAIVSYSAIEPKATHVVPRDDAAAARIANRLFSKIPHKTPVVMGDVWVGGDNIGGFTYYLLLNGRRIFNLNPTYGYSLTFDTGSGELIWFGNKDLLPVANTSVAKVGAKRAEELLGGYAQGAKNTDGIARLMAPDWPDPGHIRAELGYFAFGDRKVARLVWQGVVYNTFASKERRRGSLLMYVDAVTGKLVAPDDQGMR